jgi:hypothetical protein
LTPQLRAELLKQRSTFTNLGLLLAMLGLVLVAVLLHALTLPADRLDSASNQAQVFRFGPLLGALFAGLVGALSITGEIRHGTIRPTFLVTPARGRVVAAKVGASMLIAAGFGLVAGGVAAVAGTVTLTARGLDVRLDAGDYLLLIAGGAVAAALWAAIGVGVGAVVRNQVPALIGICAWLLFVENLLIGDLGGVGDFGRLLPGAAAKAISGQDPNTLVTPGAGLALLLAFAAAAAVAGGLATARRDVAE